MCVCVWGGGGGLRGEVLEGAREAGYVIFWQIFRSACNSCFDRLVCEKMTKSVSALLQLFHFYLLLNLKPSFSLPLSCQQLFQTVFLSFTTRDLIISYSCFLTLTRSLIDSKARGIRSMTESSMWHARS